MGRIKKVLIANRGEIAIRIIRTCRERGIRTVAVFSEPDENSPHVVAADESLPLGGVTSAESYLDWQKVLDAAKQSDSDAIHPGYGFLSENSSFARQCRDNNLIFIGPSPESIEMMGDKTRARELIAKAGVPYPPGSESELTNINEGIRIASEIGYPVLIKAAAGGGGKGMRIVHTPEEFEAGMKTAKSEAKNAFGDDRVFIEKYLEEPRHIEFQIFADQYGNTVHLFERECSIQRRHQKVIEEAPSSVIDDKLRNEMANAAISAAKSCGYIGAGTVEFLVDKHKNFYFLEMNTRLQVEHPVTELITGLDLVGLQIDVANGDPLPFKQEDIQKTGHAIECRIYAEDSLNHFLPSTGKLTRHRIPSGPGVRVDAGIEEGQDINIHYDPMISKLSVYGSDRKHAINRMLRALREYEIAGVQTTIPFCQYVLNSEPFATGIYDTHFVQNHYKTEDIINKKDDLDALAIVSSFIKMNSNHQTSVTSEKEMHNQDMTGWWKVRKR